MHFHRSLKFAITNILRNPLLSLATIIVMAIIIFVFNIVVMVNTLASSAMDDLNRRMDMQVEIKNDADPIAIEKLKEELNSQSEILKIIYISKEDAFTDFKKKFPDKANFLEMYGYPNPLPASLILKIKDANDHKKLQDFLAQEKYQDLIINGTDSDNSDLQTVASKLAKLTTSVRNIIFWVIAIFILGGLLIIINTVHLTIFQRRREISIMRLVGASLNFIRLPLIIEGAFLGGLSVIFGIGLFIFFLLYTNLSSFSDFRLERDFLFFSLWQLIIGITIGILSSYFTTEKYLKGKII